MIRVNIHDARTHLSRYIEKVEHGEVVVVCRHNKPVAGIRVIAKPATVARKEGLLKGRVRWNPGKFAPMSEEELADFDGTPVFPG